MNMSVIHNGKELDVTFGMVSKADHSPILFIAGNEKIEIDSNFLELERIREVIKDDPLALFAIDKEKKRVLFDVKVPELELEELTGSIEDDL